MERWGEKAAAAAAPAPVRTRRFADQPSFSSTLLDAIYKSMDEPDAAGGVTATKKQQSHDLHYSYYYKASLAGSYRDRARAAAPAHATTSSSSDGSSYGGFSSSEAESSQRRRLRPIRTSVAVGEAPPAPAPAPDKRATTNKPAKKPAGANIRAKLRDLRNKPASPGARLTGFLNAIFNGRRGGGGAPPTPPSAASRAADSAACSTASSSYSRSCLSKTPSTRGQPRRTVRFVDSDTDAPASAPPAERRRVQVGVVELERMLLHRMEVDSDEEDDEDDEDSSDASSDLFDLENFAAAAAAAAPDATGAAAYRDELPVYETTRAVLNRAIGHGHGHGYTHGRSTRVV